MNLARVLGIAGIIFLLVLPIWFYFYMVRKVTKNLFVRVCVIFTVIFFWLAALGSLIISARKGEEGAGPYLDRLGKSFLKSLSR